ncbi:L-lactate permease [Marinomonas fungiae]|uniref:L-lactate permease n=1 Tax=Marinomonas fungiae TaxID=1137284 RepID=UPI003A8F0B2A
METMVALAPVVFLVWSMTKQRPLASHVALPLTALLVALLQAFYFQAQLMTLLANAIAATLSVLTPISIVAGAILLNRVLVISGAEQTLRLWLESISQNKVAQLMIIGWAFAFMLEGASGFGTPAAIAAPILVGLGFSAMPVALLTLVMNSVPVSFGAVGTPAWFGFAALDLSEAQLLETSQWTALIHLVASVVIPVLALRFLVSWQAIRHNLVFILISALSCTIPYYLLAQVNYEFPSLIGGAIGLCGSIVVAKYRIGLRKEISEGQSNTAKLPKIAIFKALSPFILLIAILLVTRIQQWPFKVWLNDTSPWLSLGDFAVSQALILSWSSILDTHVVWSYKTLYVPALIPFVLTVLILIPILALSKRHLCQAASDTWGRIKLPILALIGALMMVNFMMQGEQQAPIFIIANTLASLMGANWSYVAALLGALGSFFSGSATVSNLTFGGIQYSIAEQTQQPVSLVLALQSVGASMGNMICLNNIIAVCTILGIKNQEGAMIKRTIVPMLAYALIAALMGQLILHLLI